MNAASAFIATTECFRGQDHGRVLHIRVIETPKTDHAGPQKGRLFLDLASQHRDAEAGSRSALNDYETRRRTAV